MQYDTGLAPGSRVSVALGRLVELLLDLVDDLVLRAQRQHLLHRLRGQLAGGRGDGADGVLDADLRVHGLHRRGDTFQGAGAPLRGEGALNSVPQLPSHVILGIELRAEVQDLEGGRREALQHRGHVLVLVLPREVGRGREEPRTEPNASKPQPGKAPKHASTRHGALLGNLHERHGARWRGRRGGRGGSLCLRSADDGAPHGAFARHHGEGVRVRRRP
mmetsp:Transcript_94307/g.266309  ORF Transcript_94307/g.266309 Transcript_94307/m.266309 type:complete len:219 (+) Transcript_94307:85-741(+)